MTDGSSRAEVWGEAAGSGGALGVGLCHSEVSMPSPKALPPVTLSRSQLLASLHLLPAPTVPRAGPVTPGPGPGPASSSLGRRPCSTAEGEPAEGWGCQGVGHHLVQPLTLSPTCSNTEALPGARSPAARQPGAPGRQQGGQPLAQRITAAMLSQLRAGHWAAMVTMPSPMPAQPVS